MFVVLEGLDGAGTTTQSARLVAWLEGRQKNVVATREPTGGPVGRLLRSVLRADEGSPDPSVLPWLFAADRADHLHRTVLPALSRGDWVVSDRYFHSSLAYQSLTQPIAEVWALNHTFRAPDLTLFLRVPVDICLDRISSRTEREIFEEKDRLTTISASYDKANAFLRGKGQRIVEIDGRLPMDAVFDEVIANVAELG
jgi:dTMP kinase